VAELKTGMVFAYGLLFVCLIGTVSLFGRQTPAEVWIEEGHWKRARTYVEARIHAAPNDPLANFLLSQIRGAFGDRSTPLPLAERAAALDGHKAKYHRQIAEVLGVVAQHSNVFQQVSLARRFRTEIDAALALDPRDVQANRDLLEFYLVAPGLLGGSRREAAIVAERIAALDPAEGLLAKARIAAFDRQTAQAEVLLQQAAEVQPPNYRAQIALAEFYLAPEHPNLAGAEAAAREAIGLDPGRTDAYAVLAYAYADRGSWDELDATLAEAARQAPDDLYPGYRAAERLIAGGHDLDRAERYLRAYLAQEPEGNRPSTADATRQLNRLNEARRRWSGHDAIRHERAAR
jgi:tetratricopeptide (TPR) repeat protein